jgi:hypothetical protein
MAIELNVNESQLTDILEKSINEHIQVKFTDDDFLNKLQALINQTVNSRLEQQLAKLDINDLMQKHIADYFSTSINTQATTPQLTITDQHVVNENELISTDVTVERDLIVKGSLALTGRVNVDNPSWNELKESIRASVVDSIQSQSRTELIDDVKKSVFLEGVNIENATLDGEPLVNANTLAGKITESKLQTVGTLRELTVRGHTSINNETLTVLNTRVGINTEKPSMALELWDQEVQISLGKVRKGVGFMGLANKGELHIGVNQERHISIDDQGVVCIEKLKVGRNSLKWENQVPGYNGLIGDIVFNKESKGPAGWRCLGGYQWSPF